MKTLSEVSKATGVTRRALQGYNEIGLLHPSDKTDAGHWRYDDVAVAKLLFIQVLVEAGYERMDIKALLDDSQFDWDQPFDQLISVLTEKKERLQGLINTVKIMKIGSLLPDCTLNAFGGLDITVALKNKSFAKYLNETSVEIADFDDIDSEESKELMPFWTLMSMFGFYRSADVTSAEVQACVKSIYDYSNSIESMSIKDFFKFMMEILEDIEISTMLNEQIGDGTADFITQAIRKFCKQ